MDPRLRSVLALAAACLLLVGCTGPQEVPSPPAPAAVPSPVPEPGIPHGFVEPILTDAEQRTGYPRAQFIVHHAQDAIWEDDSLGCPREDATYEQQLVEGYVVVLRLEDEDPAATEFLLDYRVRADDGTFVLCDETVVPTLP
jgi:hypothetical protein